MSGISSVSPSSNSSTQGTLGNVPPVSFPGISSGIDYNAIIQKLTALTLAQNKPLQDQVTQLNSQTTELTKIQGLINSVQGAITSLADPLNFNAFTATSSNLSAATAAQTSGGVPTQGTTTIQSQTLATSTQIFGDVGANKPANTGVSLATAGFQITPTNGTSGSGKFTVNGQTITYDVKTDTITTIVAKLNALTGVTASFAGDKLTISANSGSLSLGSATDSGNLAQIFKIDVAQLTGPGQQITSTVGGVVAGNPLSSYGVKNGGNLTINGTVFAYTTAETVGTLMAAINATPGLQASIVGGQLQIASLNAPITTSDTGGGKGFLANFAFTAPATIPASVTSAGTVGGINPFTTLNLANTTVAINGGNTFSINGVAITVNPTTDALSDVIKRINSSTAGVTASWDATNGRINLVSKATGPQSIVLGAPTDNSNFLTAFGLTSAGASTQVGNQASVTYLNSAGVPVTVYSNSNQVTNVIPGVTLNLLSSTTTPYTVTVASDSTKLTTAINTFVTAYNAAIAEINKSLTPPVVQTVGHGIPLQPGSTQSNTVVPGGVLWQNIQVEGLKDQLVKLVSGLVPTGSTSVNSLASVGLLLTSTFSVLTSTSTSGTSSSSSSSSTSSSSSSSGLQTQTFGGTDGSFQPLDTTKLQAALVANPTAVQAIFVGANSVSQSLGTYLTFVTGSPTQLGPNGSFAALLPAVSLIQGINNATSAQITSINQQIALVNNSAIQQANSLRQQFTASERLIAQLQQEQASLAGLLNNSASTGR